MRNLGAAFFLLLASVAPGPVGAEDAGGIVVSDAWARASIGAAKAGAAFLTIVNDGAELDRLVGAATPAAARAELHVHSMVDEVMQMRPVEAIEVPAGGTARLEPGGHHVMLMLLSTPLHEGTSFPLTLRFERAGDLELEVDVLAPTALGPEGGS